MKTGIMIEGVEFVKCDECGKLTTAFKEVRIEEVYDGYLEGVYYMEVCHKCFHEKYKGKEVIIIG